LRENQPKPPTLRSPLKKGMVLARLAIIVYEDAPGRQHLHLGRILEFFGVPWKTVELSRLKEVEDGFQEHVLFCSAETVAAVLNQTERANQSAGGPVAYYVYSADDRDASERGLQALCGDRNVFLRQAPAGNLVFSVSRDPADLAGPMAGIEFSSSLQREDNILIGTAGEASVMTTIISAGGSPVFVRFQRSGIPAYYCASSHIIDIDQKLSRGFFDVKDNFFSAVPLVMFVKSMFKEVARHPQELGACLIIDDPLLRKRYGSCDFGMLRDLMRRYGFTTNIAFIPWNWRRTSSHDGEFFRSASASFSVSIHGCDHIGCEFGATSSAVLDERAKLAQFRMRKHEVRTGIHHDRVMVFPQGVFSTMSPEALKRTEFLAAVNTETNPADPCSAGTQIRDVWDVAIMKYGSFPIFTRRYAHHGLENFAFDHLLGKPCLIVSHHDFFKNDCASLIELIEKLQSLNCSLRWRSLGDVIRRACSRRAMGTATEEVEMFGTELLIENPSSQVLQLHIRKKENAADLVDETRCDGKAVRWVSEGDHLVSELTIDPCSEKLFQVTYKQLDRAEKANRSLRFELSVAARRILSEFRDDYLSRSQFLSATAANLRSALTRAN
jgi:hypothetical protein